MALFRPTADDWLKIQFKLSFENDGTDWIHIGKYVDAVYRFEITSNGALEIGEGDVVTPIDRLGKGQINDIGIKGHPKIRIAGNADVTGFYKIVGGSRS